MHARRMKSIASTIVLAMSALTLQASAFVLPAHKVVKVDLADKRKPLVATAYDLLKSDCQRVLDVTLQFSDKQPQVLVGSIQGPGAAALKATGVDLSSLENTAQAFVLAVSPSGQLVIAGSDDYGTAYGMMEFSRMLGVSPWEWWADVDVEQSEEFTIPDGYFTSQSPDVTFRGMQVSDIEWGLQPWITKTFDPAGTYTIDRKTARHIFELLLRLRANLFWPPADDSARAFFYSKDGQTLASAYGIFVGKDMELPVALSDMPSPLMFSDDGFGYICRFPTTEEMHRNGGCGVYYHASYKGAPHDYLWLGTASPFLMFQQLSEAYYHGATRLWVLNVGDIKPNEYQLQLFTDMAWDIERVRQLTVGRHLEEFFAQNINRDIARLASIYMKEFYHLSFQCKPEHLAGTRLGEPAGTSVDWNAVRDLPWSEEKIRHRLTRYDLMKRNIEWLADSVRNTHRSRFDAFFELLQYPIEAAVNQNYKYLLAQLARHGKAWLGSESVHETWRRSAIAHNTIQKLTRQYNALRDDKWQGIMSSNPFACQVFQPIPQTEVQTPLTAESPSIATFYGASYQSSNFTGSMVLDPVLGLGASIRALPIPKDCNVVYKYNHNYGATKYAYIELHLLPTHPIEAQQRIALTLDGSEPQIFTYDAQVGSEEWKVNVLRNYAVVNARIPIVRASGEHHLMVAALDDGVVVDEVFVRESQDAK